MSQGSVSFGIKSTARPTRFTKTRSPSTWQSCGSDIDCTEPSVFTSTVFMEAWGLGLGASCQLNEIAAKERRDRKSGQVPVLGS